MCKDNSVLVRLQLLVSKKLAAECACCELLRHWIFGFAMFSFLLTLGVCLCLAAVKLFL